MIYTELAVTLADARSHASSVTQLMMLDRVTIMIADSLEEYKRFNRDMFLAKAKLGYGVPIDKGVTDNE
jgi:hypothetical protein